MNNKMNYEDFKKEVMATMKDYLTEEYQDFDMKFQTIKKGSGTEYEALMIGPKDRKMSVIPALNMTEAFKNYENGMPFDEVMDKLADIRMNATLPDFNKEDMFDYDKIKDRIFPRLINTASNKEYLADKPHKEIEDLSIVYAVRISEDDQGFAEAVITDDLAQMWGVKPEEIHDKAMDNIAQRPPVFQNIESVIFGEREKLEIEDIEPEKYQMPFFILTNQQKTKGAVMAVNPKTMDRITAKFGDVYVIPSSVHETLIVPKDAVDDVSDLERMVRDVNANEVRPEDQLSNNVYEYDSETHTLKIAGSGQTQVTGNGDGSGGPDEEPEETQDPEEEQTGPQMAM